MLRLLKYAFINVTVGPNENDSVLHTNISRDLCRYFWSVSKEGYLDRIFLLNHMHLLLDTYEIHRRFKIYTYLLYNSS